MIIHGSSQISALDYDPIKKELTVTWKSGGKGVYENVNATIHTRLLNSESKGSYIASVLKGNPRLYPYRRLDKKGGPLTIPIGHSPELVKKVKKSIDKIDIEAENIELELTEQKIEKLSSQFHKLIKETRRR